MSQSARSEALVVGGSRAEQERWTEALVPLVRPTAVADGAAALERIDSEVDVLLVHRDLPDQAASDLVVRAREQGYTFRAALLAETTPEEDVVEQGFDTWLLTPVEEELLTRTVEGLLACRRYDRAISNLYTLASEQATEGTDTMTGRERVEAARAEADAALEAVDTIDREALLANSPAVFRDEES
ncbi:MAG: hypothetical protein ABEJ05_03680 [Haloglomus sp.]